ncbi:hypothetical protein V7148_11385 [Gottfriedia acidiceleris]|uniref:hypothetical protein n=1 Tax=Gottfriedia acidiceleris TaxID=371036 RepID=UPI002FFD881E
MAAKIVRKVVEGKGNTTVDVTGMAYAKIEYSRTITELNLNLVGPNATAIVLNNDGVVIIPPGTTSIKLICATSDDTWKVSLHSVIPAINQSELKISKLESNQYHFSGDENLTYVGQDTDPATVDISGLSRNLETLSQLYMKASASKTVMDAAKYLKMKNLITQ